MISSRALVEILETGLSHVFRPEVSIVIGSVNFVQQRSSDPHKPTTIVATRLADYVFAIRLASDHRTRLPALIARLATLRFEPQSTEPFASNLRFQHRLGFGSAADATLLLSTIIRCCQPECSAAEQEAAWLAWSQVPSGMGGVQLLNLDLVAPRGAPRPAELRQLTFEASGVSDVSPTRHQTLQYLGKQLTPRLFDGLLRFAEEPTVDYDMPLPSATATLKVAGWPTIHTLGRAHTLAQAKTIACIETLERYAGLLSLPEENVILSSFEEMTAPAIDPREFGLHPDSTYARPDCPYRRYEPGLTIDWLLARRQSTGAQVAVPACFAFHGGTTTFPLVRLAFESSNGCALGTSEKEAQLHATLEAVERDAFLACWYRQEPLSDISELLCLGSQGLDWVKSRIELTTGFTLKILRSTQKHGIPSVIVVALNRTGTVPMMALATGAGLTYRQAARSAFGEIAGHIFFLRQRFRDSSTVAHAQRLFSCPDEVTTMEDHGILNALPESVARSGVIWTEDRPFDNSQVLSDEILSGSVAESLDCIVSRIERFGYPVYHVQHTSGITANASLHVCKAIVPGFLPMTFGSFNKRLTLRRLGDLSDRERAEALPPHPFM